MPLLPSKKAWPWGLVLIRKRWWNLVGVFSSHYHRTSGYQLLAPSFGINLPKGKNLHSVQLVSERHKIRSKERTKQCSMQCLRKKTHRKASRLMNFVLAIFRSWFNKSQTATLKLPLAQSIFMSVWLVCFMSDTLRLLTSLNPEKLQSHKKKIYRMGLESTVHHLWTQTVYAYKIRRCTLTNAQQVPPKK